MNDLNSASISESNDLLTSFDEYHSIILQEFRNYQQLEQNNFYLTTENQNILRENDELRKLVIEKDLELEQLSTKLLQTLNAITTKYNSINLEIENQKSILSLQYDLDILLTNNRHLEKDLMLQKTENERLRNSQNQLVRELQSSRMNGVK